MRFITTGRIPTDTKQETRIYPLPHTYVVKDLVPDLTQFYKQYKSIKPYLQRETKSEDVRPFRFPSRLYPAVSLTIFLSYRAARTDNPLQTANASTVYMNASSVPAAQPPAPRTGGTARNTLVPPYCSSPIAGWRTPGTSTKKRERVCWITACLCTDVIRS